ncbi:hypothetical protein EVAR_11861_1 [Eumeta japonica]|uniref:Uncharacterized protein n=1 Tax=Eumeta variegata TaxID=151549 RepID=A0A4C1U8X9_EUMVA|nr:hypothetical protein EVAR_11861_1 [Eumeta japonica]
MCTFNIDLDPVLGLDPTPRLAIKFDSATGDDFDLYESGQNRYAGLLGFVHASEWREGGKIENVERTLSSRSRHQFVAFRRVNKSSGGPLPVHYRTPLNHYTIPSITPFSPPSAHFSLRQSIPSPAANSRRFPIPIQEVGSTLVTPLKLHVLMNDDDYLLSVARMLICSTKTLQKNNKNTVKRAFGE